jgi:hypothetical protein
LVPVVSPVFWIRVNGTEPIAAVLEAWKSAHHHERKAVDAERVFLPIVPGVIVVRDAVSMVAAALLPSVVLGFKAAGAILLPIAVLLLLPLMLPFGRAP